MLRLALWTFVFLVSSAVPLSAQIVVGPTGGGDDHLEGGLEDFPFPFGGMTGTGGVPGGTSLDARIKVEDAKAAAGQRFELRITADDEDDMEEMQYLLFWDPEVLTLESWRAGEAIEEYAEDAEAPDCDIWVYPDDGVAEVETIFYELAFDTETYGTEILIMEFSPAEDASDDSIMTLLDLMEGYLDDATIEVVEPDPILRGDLNGTGTRTLVDALALVNYVFGDGSVDCERAGDLDDDGDLGTDDAVALLLGIFADAELPTEECRTDLTDDDLSCDASGCQ